ncbi:MAG: universal stress protein [Hyphomicrobiales bacterium]|nr:universal stress protein [Hyphomicrobiales bacterium]
MPFKTILAIIQSAEDAQRVSDCAGALASRFDAYLIGLHAEALPIPYSSTIGFPDAEFIQASTEVNEERSHAIEAIFRQRTARAGVAAQWRSLESFSGDSAHSGVASARSCDLVVAAQGGEDGASPDVDALLYEAGRPVLVTPREGPSLATFRKVIVAWNGSREAARATFDALPFILDAESTEILVIDPPDSLESSEPGGDIAAALERHGATVTVHSEASGGLATDDVIRKRISDTGADLLVLGAYSHSWLKQLLFGGVTRTVLHSMPVTAFLSR